ncbi:MAG: LemA family protein [Planctomycetota bacterium]|nr:LemA family protein [Planctomycetota bacterium]
MIWWIVSIGVLLAVVVFAAALQNRLASARVKVEGAFSQIDVQLARRHDLVPRLVETVRAAMSHERETLERVTLARTRAAESLAAASADRPGDLAASEKALGEAVGVLVARVESYPELRSHENVLALQEELVTTENRVAFARHAYNDAVVRLNELRSTFPTNVVAGVLSYQAGELLDWPDRSIADAPALDFDREPAS